ncbi:MAG: hypothetical protein WD489_03960 [Rhodovibrionaceae bacterium]
MTERNNTVPLITEQLLEDYADGRLDTQTERRVEGLIAQDHAQRDKVFRMIALREAIRADVSARAGVPTREETYRLIEEIGRRRSGPARIPLRKAAMAMAACLLLVAMTGVVWSQFGADKGGLQQAALQTLLAPVGDKTQAQAVEGAAIPATIDATTPATTPRQGMPEFVPDFAASGFNLVETRVLSGEPDEAVHLLYEAKNGHRVSLYYSRGSEKGQNQQVTLRQEGPLAVLFWYADGRSFSMIGEVERSVMIELARTVTSGLSLESKQDEGSAAPQSSEPKQEESQQESAPEPEKDTVPAKQTGDADAV